MPYKTALSRHYQWRVIPHYILTHPGLSIKSKLAYGALVSNADENGMIPSIDVDFVAKALGISVKAAHNAVSVLGTYFEKCDCGHWQIRSHYDMTDKMTERFRRFGVVQSEELTEKQKEALKFCR